MPVPLVSIGILNYNCIRYLLNCVRSYLNQSYGNIEIIVVDDCSTDGSIEILQQLERNYENIKCIYHVKNSGGPSQGIQELIKEAQGKYFQWIASDDYVKKNAIEKFVNYLETTNNDYVFCNFNIINEKNMVTAHWNYIIPTLDEIVSRIFANCSGVIPMNGLYRSDFFHKNNLTWINYKNNEYSGDTINSLYLIKNGMKYGMINKSLIYYRVHKNNRSHNVEERIRTSLTVHDYIIKNFNEEIYLPNIKWSKYTNREQLKNYAIASFLYNKIMGYIRLESLPCHIKVTITKEKIKECLSPFIEEGLHYIQAGLTQGDTLKNKLVDLEKQYKNIF